MGESVWVLGASMTKISRYPDKDVVDLAAEATFNALDDAGVSIFDIQVLAAGSMFNMGGIGQQVAKQVGQTGSKPNTTASVPSSSVPATNVVSFTFIPRDTCSGSGSTFTTLAFTSPPPSRSTTDDT